jgi:disulfide bond formation protein DsbB
LVADWSFVVKGMVRACNWRRLGYDAASEVFAMKCAVFQRYLNVKRLVLLAAAVSAFFLGFALVSQYGFGLFPCELCLMQRVPYAAIMGIGVMALFVRAPRALWGMAALCAVLFAVDSGIGLYHALVEMHIVTGPSACTASTKPQTLEEMRAAIMNAQLVSCDQPMVHVLGLSMAGWNALAAAGSAVMMALGLRCVGKRAA